ncbi:MAG: GNAT family N-acetyltransferase [Nitrospiraceae bacterium]|nr:MAG: GNAT family N-acetyltransferase [Nitrospiraceae bacterium]
MLRIRECSDPDECQHIWKQVWPLQGIFDFWEIRACFLKDFNRPSHFLVAEKRNSIRGVLPLSWVSEEKYFAMFPGETWKGKTWLEQNRIPAHTAYIRNALLTSIPGAAHLRYLTPESTNIPSIHCETDETGYIFSPRQYGYTFSNYIQQLSAKFRKNYTREISRLELFGLSYRHNCVNDVDHLFRMNLEAFGDASYFCDKRFLRSFENLVAWLSKNKLLRITTILIAGHVAAVDIGAVWAGNYTVLAGGTNPEFKGVAKLINFHHIEWSCAERIASVDFLCGDFGWKERFRLSPRPLYQIKTGTADNVMPDAIHSERKVSCAL